MVFLVYSDICRFDYTRFFNEVNFYFEFIQRIVSSTHKVIKNPKIWQCNCNKDIRILYLSQNSRKKDFAIPMPSLCTRIRPLLLTFILTALIKF